MEIGQPKRVTVVEPIESPVPKPEGDDDATLEPVEPVPEPARAPA
jgi:hypothetical protein